MRVWQLHKAAEKLASLCVNEQRTAPESWGDGEKEQITLSDSPTTLPGIPHLMSSSGCSLNFPSTDCFPCTFSKEWNLTHSDHTPGPLVWAMAEGEGEGSYCKAGDAYRRSQGCLPSQCCFPALSPVTWRGPFVFLKLGPKSFTWSGGRWLCAWVTGVSGRKEGRTGQACKIHRRCWRVAGATQRKRMHLLLFPGPRHFLFDQNNGKQHILLLLHVTV